MDNSNNTNVGNALKYLEQSISKHDQHQPIAFKQFLETLTQNPAIVLRSIFQVFHDMIKNYTDQCPDEYPGDSESIKFVKYDCRRLFSDNTDNPFFADRLFANRFISHIETFKTGAQQNKIFIFKGPPGCGKSTFLNNLLLRFEEYTNTYNGACFEVVWKLRKKQLGGEYKEYRTNPILQKMIQLLNTLDKQQEQETSGNGNHLDISGHANSLYYNDEKAPILIDNYIEVPCPSHDHPILLIPKDIRRNFLNTLLINSEFKEKLFNEKGFDWVFKDNPCTICSSIYAALLKKLKSPLKVFEMIFVRPYQFNRRIGEGISVFNPSDQIIKQNVLSNQMLQKRLNSLFKDSNQVKFVYSRYAKTNNGIYALMDIKANNAERLIDLHNIISEAVHKVDEVEENVISLFIALMNPEDKKNIQDFQSFSDRIEYINIPYVLDIQTEVEIYTSTLGKQIINMFLPRVLHNFARVIVSSRLNIKSDALLEWIGDPKKYRLFCDENLQLLKMELYTGNIPKWLSEEDIKRYNAKRRRKIIAESEKEGERGFSGRDSIQIFNEFYTIHSKDNKLITMSQLRDYFTVIRKDLSKLIPYGFLDSLLHYYNYTVLQEVKESLYYYNEQQISKEIQNYLFAINFEPGSVETCKFTGEKLEINEGFLENFEIQILGKNIEQSKRISFRKETQKHYTSKTLTQEIMFESKHITETELYKKLQTRYTYNLKEKVLEPFLDNKNFRRAIKDFDKNSFKTYDKKIKDDITFLMKNLCEHYNYTSVGAKEICMYVIDNDLAKTFTQIS